MLLNNMKKEEQELEENSKSKLSTSEEKSEEIIEIIEKDPAVKEEIVEYVVSSYKGPLPPAEEFQKYENAVPGAGKIILDMASTNLTYSKKRDSKLINFNFINTTIAQVASTAITVIFVIAGTYLLANNKPIEGILAMFTYPGYIAFLRHKNSKDSD